MHSTRWILLGAAAVVAACASAPPEPASTAASFAGDAGNAAETKTVVVRPTPVTQDTVVCREEARVGTHFKRRRCYTRGQIEEARENSQRWMRTRGNEGSVTAVR